MVVQPFTPDLPRQPEALTRGLCASGEYPADWWTADGNHPRQRAAAVEVCKRCPVLDQCRAWAVTLPHADHAIYGAMSTSERLRRRAEQNRLAVAPAGGARHNAAKGRCDSGHLLAGGNLVMVTDPRDGRTYRQCRECRRARTRAYQARRRLLDREAVNARKRAAYAARKAAA